MRKPELVNAVKERASLTNAQANEAVTAVIDTILEAIANNDTVSIVGFGTFKAEHKDAREVRNPATGGTVTVPEHFAPKFSFADSVKAKFKNGNQSEYIR